MYIQGGKNIRRTFHDQQSINIDRLNGQGLVIIHVQHGNGQVEWMKAAIVQ